MKTEAAEWVICGGPARTTHARGAVVHDQGAIQWVGTLSDLPERYPAPAHNGDGSVLMPGFVNSHAHTAMSLMRGIADGVPLKRWLSDYIWPIERRMTDDDAFCGSALGGLEMITGGIIGSAEMYAFDQATVDGLRLWGIKMSIASTIFGLNGPGGWTPHERIEHVIDFHGRLDSSTTRVDMGLHAVYSLGIDLVEEAASAAAAHGIGIHIHLAETDESSSHGTELSQLTDAGVLDTPVLGAHGSYLTRSDMAALSDNGLFRGIAHCPVSNMRMGAKSADVVGLRSHGVIVGIGTDGPVSGGPLDMFEAMRAALGLARHTRRDPSCLRTADVLEMATSGSAACAGLNSGVLEPGRPADMIRMSITDHRHIPHRSCPEWATDAVVLNGKPSDITDVWIDGELRVRGGLPVDTDAAARVPEEAALRGLDLLRRSNCDPA